MFLSKEDVSKFPNPLFVAFEGAIIVRLLPHATRAFVYDITFHLKHPRLLALNSKKPPLHFHPYQKEYMQVLEGELFVEVDGVEMALAPEHGEITVRPWQHHRLYPHPSGGRDTMRFLLSADDTPESFKIDNVFFQNWYAYQDEVVLHKGGHFDVLQVMNMFDAGGSYLSLPTWMPFRCQISRAAGILLGRWIGGLAGYQPFREEWTTEWELACKKMSETWTLRRFAHGIQ
ncbi:hypothetical protein EJ05DRAFT_167131 [Pseudovirgaria hyperparasitica]|uniref:Cupin 2 conserved barrel domain-containing protein n=1 Tax=Pseudovirgaria hyperparasitica TaxID=470096 RepID=A0A6A6VV43_9PEZI|nr:uncharacterized protein EJ05DRAFT_167131 [Pseudovirgaria hyperparasitica]KAF2753656.1 hypothetical protein EJ05DRAFT_167131 [Pseudovirgaria hyperparasitica]